MIKVNNLVFSYPKQDIQTIKGIDFQIDRGQIFGFLGPSGAGKSTVQKILTKLLENYSGDISVMGKPLKSWNHLYYEHIGVGFELPNHYLKLTALENLRFFASFYRKKMVDPMALLSKIGLEKDAQKKVEEFSKGMKMRLSFVRALLHDPEILFFDEPTSGLDPVNARIMKDIILDLKKEGKTIFLTTHNMQDANELCDQVAFITDGEIRLVDAPRQLRLDYGSKTIQVEYRNGELNKKEFNLDGLGNNSAFQQLIREFPIESIHSQEATLEDIFITVTGKSLI